MASTPLLLVSTGARVRVVDPDRGTVRVARGLDGVRPSPLAADPHRPGRAWCGTRDSGVLRSDDAGTTWRPAGLAGTRVTAVAVSPAEPGRVWAGTEPSHLWGWREEEDAWTRASGLRELPSSSEWSFPPRPETDHVRWIVCHPRDAGRLWLAIEAGALVGTPDGGGRWRDRERGGPRDTHEAVLHPEQPDILRVAAGDGYFERRDGGGRWSTPREGLEVGYLRSIAVDPGDPEAVVVSGASGPRTAYVAPDADGRLHRRAGSGSWTRITAGWPEDPSTVAPLLRPGTRPGELWAADERGVHGSSDGGRSWTRVADLPVEVRRVDGLAVLPGRG
jgi:photosystem II stability/assembly factor-like uncharacterized protein